MIYTPENIIEIRQLKKRYDRKNLILRGVDLEVKRGEIYGILGTNGAGKTTLLKILEALIKPTSGTVLLNGLDIAKNPRRVKYQIGVQIQQGQGGFYPRRTLLELLEIFGRFYGLNLNLNKRKRLLEFVNLLPHAQKYAAQLSGGQRQRFAICAALAHDPPVLILDEPTAALDPNEKRRVWKLLQALQNKEKTILMTTHYMREAEVLCNQISILDAGVITATGSPANLISRLQKQTAVPEYGNTLTIEDVYVHLTGGETL